MSFAPGYGEVGGPAMDVRPVLRAGNRMNDPGEAPTISDRLDAVESRVRDMQTVIGRLEKIVSALGGPGYSSAKGTERSKDVRGSVIERLAHVCEDLDTAVATSDTLAGVALRLLGSE